MALQRHSARARAGIDPVARARSVGAIQARARLRAQLRHAGICWQHQVFAAVKQAIATFEPRLDAKSLSVKIEIDPKQHHNTLQLTVRASMWAQPVPLEVLLKADVDLETGHAQMRDMN